MNFVRILLALSLAALASGAARAQEEIDKAKAESLRQADVRRPPRREEDPMPASCAPMMPSIWRKHPKQKVGAMKLLVQAEYAPEDKITNYSFRLGVKYRNRPGNFDSSGYCNHVVAEDAGNEIRYGCGVDCDGGGIECRRVEGRQIGDHPPRAHPHLAEQQAGRRGRSELVAGADDKIFRLDRVDISECASLVTDRKELAALRRK